MATQLTIVNNVLQELREDAVANVNDTTYSQLIGKFVNRAKAWAEDVNHQWSVYITEIDTTILADDSTRSYDLTSTTDRSVLMRDTDMDWIPQAYDITSGEVRQLFDVPYSDLLRERAIGTNDSSKTVSIPTTFSIVADADGRGWTLLTLWPVASTASARSWRTYWYVPQADLALDGTDDDTEILLPSFPLELYALYLALNERGEEMGQPGGLAAGSAQAALASALERDQQVQRAPGSGGATDWNNNESL
ncbi:MAG: hypothetical protein ACYSW0_24055 [Planctomycetota bacterium]|jgi:hypothetical protein